MKLSRLIIWILLSLSTLALQGCNSNNDDDTSKVNTNSSSMPYQLRILHINDHHSHLDPDTTKLTIAKQEVTLETGGFPSVVTEFKTLAAKGGNVLKLHGGDSVTGTAYYSLNRGKSDAALMNEVCFDALALGNHEFDAGDQGLVTYLNQLKQGNCNTAILSANTFPKKGISPLTLNTETDYIRPYIIKELNGEKIGIIGLTTAQKTSHSSSPDPTTVFLDEALMAQVYINKLKSEGVNKIILLVHYPYNSSLLMAKQLEGVDVIVGGDSHSLLGKQFSAYGLSPEGDYPTITKDANGKMVCVVQAWQYSQIVGELSVDFDANGEVTQCSGTPHLLVDGIKKIGDTAVNLDATTIKNAVVTRNSTDAQMQVIAALQSTPSFSLVTPDKQALAILKPYKEEKENFGNTIIGKASTDLCFERIPGQGRSTISGCNNLTYQNGSDISNIVAKGFLEMSKNSDICIQNGGGVRIDVPAGDISVETAYTLLPFANTLTEIDITGQQIKDVLEEAVDYSLSKSGSTGAYPYAAGLRWHVNLAAAKGARLSNLEVNPRLAGTWTALDMNKSYKLVTSNYTASGQDGYTTFGKIDDSKKTNTYLDYAQSFVDYVTQLTNSGQMISKLPVSEYSTQSCTPDAEGKYCTPPTQ